MTKMHNSTITSDINAINPAKNFKKILYYVTIDSYFCSHRLNVALSAKKAGFEVAVATTIGNKQELIESKGIKVFPLKHMHRSKINPFKEFLAVKEIYKICKKYKPDIVHNVAMKPVLYGSIVAMFLKIPKVVNAFGGLGYIFTGFSFRTNLLIRLKKFILRSVLKCSFTWVNKKINSCLILQNEDDARVLIKDKFISEDKIKIIRGNGINTEQYSYQEFPVKEYDKEVPKEIVLFARLVWDKGIAEFVTAAKILKSKYPNVKFVIYGNLDSESPVKILQAQLDDWIEEGIIEYRGYCNNVIDAIAKSYLIVLPTYREGLPRGLLEASSCGRAIVATDVPGCREIVVNNETGILVPAKNGKALASGIETLIKSENLCKKMGLAGRERIIKYFSDVVIEKQILALYTSPF